MSGQTDPRAWRSLGHRGAVALLSVGALLVGVRSALGGESGLANPADRFCVDNEFELVQVYDATGVAVSSVCIDRRNNKKCNSWAFYRGECMLGRKDDAFRKDEPVPKRRTSGETGPCGLDFTRSSERLGASRRGRADRASDPSR